MGLRSKILNSRLYKTIFGYDIFISYSRKDSLDYAYAISKHFISKGYECYIDQLSSISPGKELPQNITSALKRSTSLIIIGSEGSKTSIPIQNEIELFLKHNKNKPIIPITIDDGLNNKSIWFEKIEGLAIIDDSLDNLKNSSPSDEVLDRIQNALKFTKKSKNLRRITLLTLFSVVLITGAALIYSSFRVKQSLKKIEIAEQLANEQSILANNSKEETRIARIEKTKADSLKNILSLKSDSLDKEIKIKNISLEESKHLYTEQYNSALDLTKQLDLAIDAVPYKKGYHASELLKINPGELVLFSQLNRALQFARSKPAIDQFVEDWRASTNHPMIIISGYYAGFRIDDESRNIIKLSGKGTSAYNMEVSSRLSKSAGDYLIDKGISREKIIMKAYGDTKQSPGVLFNNRIEITTSEE